jgi:hypothetical protein
MEQLTIYKSQGFAVGTIYADREGAIGAIQPQLLA